MKILSSKRRVALTVAVVLLLLFAFRPGASRLKSRIITSISYGVARPVDIGSVHIRLLPRPGFDLANLVVYDDPAFGAEPMLRATDVTASLRLTSLVRGRFEIARLDLVEPSLNLVRAENGRWNVESLLERAAHTPLAPTGKAKTEPRPGFPYIQATSARINLKTGQEKKPYALTNADFSLWQESENAWGVRLKAQPVRTDINLYDTGTLQMNGTWQRAATLRDTPLNFNIEWDQAQLGQLTKLLTGNDQGWRGTIRLDVKAVGTPGKLQVSSQASIQDFRRYDITSGQALRLAAQCDGTYSSSDRMVRELGCLAPVGDGEVSLKGDFGADHDYALTLKAENVPASAWLALARRAKQNLPEDLTASGSFNGSFTFQKHAPQSLWEGQGEVAELRVDSVIAKAAIGPLTVPVRLSSGESIAGHVVKNSKNHLSKNRELLSRGSPHLEFGPVSPGGHATTQGWINRTGYEISLEGETEIAKLLRVGRMLGIPVLQTTAEGSAQLDLRVSGLWPGWNGSSGFSGPRVTGTAKLRHVRVPIRGAGSPIEISSVDVRLLPGEVRIENLNARAADASWSGALQMPRGCGTPDACQIHFDLSANQISLADLSAWMRPRAREQPWYSVLANTPAPPFFASLRASGRLIADKVSFQSVAATRASANVSLDRGKLTFAELNADFLGGKHHGTWQVDFSAKKAACSGSGSLTGVSLARFAEALKDPWIAGTASGTYQVSAPVLAGGEFWQEAEGVLQFEVTDGSFLHISLAEDEGPLKITRFSGRARLQSGELEFKEAKLESQDARFQLSGTYFLKRDLDFKLERASPGAATGYAITGTLSEPHVAPLPGAVQAQLKP